MNDSRNWKRLLLYLVVGSVILGAALGIIIVVRNTWGWFEVRVILTTITVAIASLCGLACDLSRTPRGANLLPTGGLVLTFIAAGLVLIGLWSNFGPGAFWMTTASVSIFTVATVHVCLLSIVRLASRFYWIFIIACQDIYGLAFLLSAMIIWEMDDNLMFRFVAVLSIIAAALTLVFPLLHRISKTDKGLTTITTPLDKPNIVAIDEEIALLEKRISDLEKLRSNIPARTADA